MGLNPEHYLQKKESHERRNITSDSLAHEYQKEASALIESNDVVARDAVARFAQNILESKETEQTEYIERLFNALRGKEHFFDRVPDDATERTAFALALAKAHLKSLQ